jgi:hypothetical protein
MAGLFTQKFKLNGAFENLNEPEFVKSLADKFDLDVSIAQLLFDGVFSYKKEFLFSDFENYLSQDERTTFFANPLVVEK